MSRVARGGYFGELALLTRVPSRVLRVGRRTREACAPERGHLRATHGPMPTVMRTRAGTYSPEIAAPAGEEELEGSGGDCGDTEVGTDAVDAEND